MRIQDIYYVAGLLEGEGCFGFVGGYVNIQLSMTDPEPVRRVRNIMSPNTIVKSRNASYTGHKTYYTFRIGGNLAVQWMMTLYPIMSPRRKIRIEEALGKWKESRRTQKPNQASFKLVG